MIVDRYELVARLGAGGMGEVWSASHLVTKRRVAIKLLKADAQSPDAERRVVREARAATLVAHPAIVPIHDVLTLDDRATKGGWSWTRRPMPSWWSTPSAA